MTKTTDEVALDAVEAIFSDLRDRRFLKWLFDRAGDANLIGLLNGDELRGLDLEVQGQIKAAWQAIITSAIAKAQESFAEKASALQWESTVDVWRDCTNWYAHTPFGTYYVLKSFDGWSWSLPDADEHKLCNGPEEGKAAAQAHWADLVAPMFSALGADQKEGDRSP